MAGNPTVDQWMLVVRQGEDHAGTLFVWRPGKTPTAEHLAYKARLLDAHMEETYGYLDSGRSWHIYQGPTEPIEDVWPT